MGPPEWGHDDDPCQPLPLTQMVATDYGSTGEGLTVFRAGWLGAAGGSGVPTERPQPAACSSGEVGNGRTSTVKN